MEIFIKLKSLDRRWVFLCVALAVALPMVFQIDFPVYPSKSVKGIYNFVQNKLPENSRAYLSFDYDPASEPELRPSAVAVLVHMFRKNIKPICAGNWPLGGEMAESALASATQVYERTYDQYKKEGKLAPGCKKKLVSGIDYVNVGYKPGALILVKAITSDLLGSFPTDREGNSTKEMPIFKTDGDHKFTLKDTGFIMSFTAGTGGIETFISVAGDHGRKMAAACTSVNIPRFTTYIQTGQLVGMTGGLPGAAEYEALIDYYGAGRAGMAPQSISHLVIMLFIIMGNLAFIAEKKKAMKKV